MNMTIKFIAFCAVLAGATTSFSMQNSCAAQSGALVTPVIELYTSEGCSSCVSNQPSHLEGRLMS